MRRQRPGAVRNDPAWAIASSIQLQERVLEDGAASITARRHPTGWFITAAHPPGLPADEREDFRQFVCVRVYLLLHDGPRAGVWEARQGEWVAEWSRPEESHQQSNAAWVPDGWTVYPA